MVSRYIPSATMKFLFIKSGGKCALCQNSFFSQQNEKITLFGKMCHIRGFQPGSSRYDKNWPREKINSYENIVLLCSNCHDLVDSNPQEYTITSLLGIKEAHERKIEFLIEKGDLGPIPDSIQIEVIPAVLELVTQAIQMEPKDALFMRPGRPAMIDFEEGKIVWRQKEMQKLSSVLKLSDTETKFATAVLSGISGSGKTTSALHLGLRLWQSNWLVLYVNAELVNLSGKETEICEYFHRIDKHTLLIIDNANICTDSIRSLLNYFNRIKYKDDNYASRILLVNRVGDDQESPQRLELLPLLSKDKEIPLKTDKDFIGLLVKSIVSDIDSIVEFDLETLIKLTGYDLPLVGTAILQLADTGSIQWDNLSEYAIQRRLGNLNFIHQKTGEIILLLIAVFTKVHCYISYGHLNEIAKKLKLTHVDSVLESLFDEGHISSVIYKREVLLSLGHPSIANLINYHESNKLEKVFRDILPDAVHEEIETHLWIQYCKSSPPDFPLFLTNLTFSLLVMQNSEPAKLLFSSLDEFHITSSSFCTSLNNLSLLLRLDGLLDEAVKVSEKSIELDDNRGDTWTNLGFIYESMKKYEQAKKALQRACDLLPEIGFVFSNLGNLLTELGEFDDAGENHRRAIELDSDNPSMWCNLAAYYVDQKMFSEAEDAFNKAIELDSLWLDAIIGLAKINTLMKQSDRALDLLNSSLKIQPKSIIHLLDISAGFHLLGKHAKAETIIRKALDRAPNDLQLFLVLASILQSTDRIKEIKKEYSIRQPLESDDAELWSTLGNSLLDSEMFEDAKSAFVKSLDLDSELGGAIHGLATAHSLLEMYDEAEELYCKAIEKGVNSEEVWIERAISLRENDKFSKALEVIDSYLDINSESAKAHFQRGNILTRILFIDSAIEAFGEAVKIDSKFYEAWLNLGNKYLMQRNIDKAEEAYRMAIKANKQYGKGWAMLGAILQKRGEYLKAEKALRKSIKLDPSSPLGYLNLANLLLKLNRKKEAKKMQKKGQKTVKEAQKAKLPFFVISEDK